MTVLYVVIGILLIGFIVMAHEFGHYLVGRLCGIGIDEFSVGFGPKIVQWKKNGTAYSMRAIPMGGYCKFTGEDESSDDPRAMVNANVWKRIATVFAGPFMNFVLAFVLTVIIFAIVGVQVSAPVVGAFLPNYPAEQNGLQVGDLVTSVDGRELSADAQGILAMREYASSLEENDVLHLTVERGGDTLEVETPVLRSEEGSLLMGIQLGYRTAYMSPLENVRYSAETIVSVMGQMLEGLKNLVFKGEGIEDTGGPVRIVEMFVQQIPRGADVVVELVILISINLGIMNLLPLPALDGGRLIFLFVEAIRRKPINRDREGMVHLIGLAALMVLIVLITYKDIARLITG